MITLVILTVEERGQLATQINANESIGRTEMIRWFNGISYTFPINVWKEMLTRLEVYAGDAFNVTEAHKATVMGSNNLELIKHYNYFTGYPEKLTFTL